MPSLIAYVLGTGLPVLAIAFVLALGANNISAIHKKISIFEKWARKITGVIFIFGGLYYIQTILNLNLNILGWFTLLADYSTYSLLGLDSKTHLAEAIHFFIEDVTKIFFLLFVMTTVVSFFRSKLNPEKVREYLEGKPKWLAYLLAIILGAITPFCSCSSIPLYSNATGVIPIAEALLGKGVPIGTVLAMMMSVVAISLPEMIMF